MEYKFKLPIGDWSGDGHNRCDYFLIDSNYPVEQVREFYFNACEKAGYEFNEVFCAEYEDRQILEEQLEKYPIPFDISEYKEEWKDIKKYYKTEYDWYYYFSSEEFANIFLKWIQYYNPEFNFKFAEENECPMFPFYGFDEKKQHIGFIGYGLFE